MLTRTFALAALFALPVGAEPAIDTSRARDVAKWKPQIAAYSLRHYGKREWALQPTCIILHYTATSVFPWNLVKSHESAGESPGLASHYVIDGSHIWQILPPDIRSRGAYGINHLGINIEMVARNSNDLANRKQTLEAGAQLTAYLMGRFHIPLDHIYSHQQVSKMNPVVVPGVLDRVNPAPYGKSDPGEKNMATIKQRIRQILR